MSVETMPFSKALNAGLRKAMEDAGEHGHALAEWILDHENYSHPDYVGRNIDGRFGKGLSTRSLRVDDD